MKEKNKNIYWSNISQRKAGVAILISDKGDLRTKKLLDRGRLYIMIEGSIHEDIAILKMCIYQTTETQNVKKVKKKSETKRNIQIHKYSWRFQQPSLNNCYNN